MSTRVVRPPRLASLRTPAIRGDASMGASSDCPPIGRLPLNPRCQHTLLSSALRRWGDPDGWTDEIAWIGRWHTHARSGPRYALFCLSFTLSLSPSPSARRASTSRLLCSDARRMRRRMGVPVRFLFSSLSRASAAGPRRRCVRSQRRTIPRAARPLTFSRARFALGLLPSDFDLSPSHYPTCQPQRTPPAPSRAPPHARFRPPRTTPITPSTRIPTALEEGPPDARRTTNPPPAQR